MGSEIFYSLYRPIAQFRQSQAGGGTVMSMFGLVVCLILGGLAIDSANAWRNKGLLNLTADVAAHAGVVALAQGAEKRAVLDAAQTAIEFNMPQNIFGRTVRDASYDIALRRYDPKTNSIMFLGEPNAVVVTLQRSKEVHNAVPTFLLGLIGLHSWDIKVRSVAMIGETRRCDSSEGIFARGKVTLNSQNQVGADYCIHSQQHVALPSRNTFAAGSVVSMPNIVTCGDKCRSSSNPGIRTLAVNMIMPDLRDFIQQTHDAFINDFQVSKQVSAFFRNKSFGSDLSALAEVGVGKSVLEGLEKGAAVSLTKLQFSRLREFPEGLTYNVSCQEGSVGQEAILQIGGAPFSLIMQNIALTTNCEINFGKNADIRGSLIITTRAQQADTITATVGAAVGDPLQACDAKQHTVIMSLGKQRLPASFAASNVTFVAANDVLLIGAPNAAQTLHRGVAIHATGQVHITGEHEFQSCNNTPDTLAPSLKVLRHVTPYRRSFVVVDNNL